MFHVKCLIKGEMAPARIKQAEAASCSMYVVLTYDVAAKRTPKLLRICRKYLFHEQRSVFEGVITDAKLTRLKAELKRQIVPDEDSVNIYEFESLRYTVKEQIGRSQKQGNIL